MLLHISLCVPVLCAACCVLGWPAIALHECEAVRLCGCKAVRLCGCGTVRLQGREKGLGQDTARPGSRPTSQAQPPHILFIDFVFIYYLITPQLAILSHCSIYSFIFQFIIIFCSFMLIIFFNYMNFQCFILHIEFIPPDTAFHFKFIFLTFIYKNLLKYFLLYKNAETEINIQFALFQGIYFFPCVYVHIF